MQEYQTLEERGREEGSDDERFGTACLSSSSSSVSNIDTTRERKEEGQGNVCIHGRMCRKRAKVGGIKARE